MMVLISYDVRTLSAAGRRRLRRVARACLDFGQRVQLSVFECPVEPAQWASLKNRLVKEIDPTTGSLRFYYLGANWRRRVEHVGAKPVPDRGAAGGLSAGANRKRTRADREVRPVDLDRAGKDFAVADAAPPLTRPSPMGSRERLGLPLFENRLEGDRRPLRGGVD